MRRALRRDIADREAAEWIVDLRRRPPPRTDLTNDQKARVLREFVPPSLTTPAA